MVAVGMLVIWGGYSLGLFGWTLFRDYNVTLGQLVNPVHPYGSAKGQKWPPGKIPDTQVWPGAAASTGAASSSGGKHPCPQGFVWNSATGKCGPPVEAM